MPLKIYNSLTKEKEIFKPIRANEVSMYVCGMTVYDYCHIGHARLMIVFDVVARYLRYAGYNLYYVQNITDIDDKIIKRAQENNEDYQALTDRFIKALHHDLNELNVLLPDIQPKATDYVQTMQQIIAVLLDKGFAYIATNGDVMYAVNKFAEYGKLSHRNLADLQAGARIEVDKSKRDPLDFVLWKTAKPGEPSWNSPWGEGRPGWHIECSAMSMDCLHKHIDIHGGGMDLKFPHHENEIAQTEAYNNEKFVNYWMHVGYLQVDNEKMSKSLNNFFLVKDVLQHYSAEQLRFFMLVTHYRKPINYSNENLNQAAESLIKLYTALRNIKCATPLKDSAYEQAFKTAMGDDFNTSEAITVLFTLAKDINKLKEVDLNQAQALAGLLKYLGGVLGLLQAEPEYFFQDITKTEIDVVEIEKLIQLRNEARQNKDWKEADHLRDKLQKIGIVLEDKNNTTSWRREK